MSLEQVNAIENLTGGPVEGIKPSLNDDSLDLATTSWVQDEIDDVLTQNRTVSGNWTFSGSTAISGDVNITGTATIDSVAIATEDYVDNQITAIVSPTTYVANYNWTGSSGTLSINTGITSISNISSGYFQVNMTDIGDANYVAFFQPTEGLQGFYASLEQAYKTSTGFRFHVRDFATSAHYTGQFTFNILVINL